MAGLASSRPSPYEHAVDRPSSAMRSDSRLELRVGMKPRQSDELIVREGRGTNRRPAHPPVRQLSGLGVFPGV